ncbi:MAG: carboxylating nicotinate-nucleotide diphosphorylase [Armatimonadetes bacterium]|nr:carboxylating nicotinate-nucleotide diphosphorylase [Armatimonadota bacterium]
MRRSVTDERLSDLAADSRRVAELALSEDGDVDITSELTVALETRATGVIEFRQEGVVAGTAYADAVVALCGGSTEWLVDDGASVSCGAHIGSVRGDLAGILRAERPLLNILQRACGIATATREYARAVAGTKCRILHTRKTAPGLRGLDVRAVLSGGGEPHRIDLEQAVMIKDNHWSAMEREGTDLSTVCQAARSRGVTDIYVEVETLAQVKEALKAGATRLLVDNQSPQSFGQFVDTARSIMPDVEIEATGGITLENVREYAVSGADFASIGALTHSVTSVDLALEVTEIE